MLLDSFVDVDLVEGTTDLSGYPVYVVIDNKPRKAKSYFFNGETGYQDAQRKFNDLVIPRVHS